MEPVKPEPLKLKDKTVLKSLSFSGSSLLCNPTTVDVMDGKVVRIRPMHVDDYCDLSERNPWKLEKNGYVLDQGTKGYIPPFSIAYKQRTYSKNRIPYPLKRVDWDPHGERNPQNRGKSKYERISWDEAIQIVASEINRMHETYGHSAILVQGDGHGEHKVFSGVHGCNISLLAATGERGTVQVRNADSWEGWYWGGKHIWGMDPVGEQMLQNNLIKDIAENGDAVLFWGCDLETTPWGWGGQFPSVINYWFTDIGIKSIYICPDVNYACAVHADMWIPILPNTDAAMQLAIAYVWMTEGTYEKEYLETHAVGYEWFEYYVLGNEDGVPKTPKWAEEKCGVPSYRIKALARYWAKHNVSIGHGNGGSYIRSCFSHEPARLEVALLGMQGLGHPGRNQVHFIEWTLFAGNKTPTLCPVPVAELYCSFESVWHGAYRACQDPFIPKTLIPEAILEKDLTWYGHTMPGLPYWDQFQKFEYPMKGFSRIHMIWSDAPCWETCWNGGFLFEDALVDPDIQTVVIQHQWFEDACRFADILLPVSTMLEVDDLGMDKDSGQWSTYFNAPRAVDPCVDSKSDYEIVYTIGKELEKYGGIYEGLFDTYTQGFTVDNYDEAMRYAFEHSGIRNIEPDFTYDMLQEKQVWVSKTREDWAEIPAGMIEFYADPIHHPLSTPSGKLEYYSAGLAQHFPDDHERGPVPHWIEESELHKERLSSDRAKEYPFLLVSNHPRWRIHAMLDDVSWLREIGTCKVKGPDGYLYEPIWVNPRDAERLGFKQGDVLRMYNERGSVLGGCYVTERIMPGVLYQDHGARVDVLKIGTGGIDRGGANNLIAPDATSSKNCAGEVTSGFLVGVDKVDPFEYADLYPEEFNRAYDPESGLIPDSFIVES